MSDPDHLEQLRAEARHHRERRDLYRAKAYGARPTTVARLQELERLTRGAELRLRQAEQRQHLRRAGDDAGSGRSTSGPSR